MAVTFEILKGLLIRYVTLRVRNGDCTERQLAKLVGVSQPQLHNVLKGARPLKQQLGDALLKHFQIGLLELVVGVEWQSSESSFHDSPPSESADAPARQELVMLEQLAIPKKAAASERQASIPAIRRAN